MDLTQASKISKSFISFVDLIQNLFLGGFYKHKAGILSWATYIILVMFDTIHLNWIKQFKMRMVSLD